MTCAAPDVATSLAAEVDRLGMALTAARAESEAAAARERSRIADDLHDILGHALAVVAFKAELAGRLLHVDSDRAREEIVEIQQVSRSAMNDVRGLTRPHRPTDLEAGLVEAVTLFRSAEVDVSVVGDARSVVEDAKDPLARVLREAVTNVLRHADPGRCLIAVEQTPFEAGIAVVNDGVVPVPSSPASGGTGLAGLSRMLGEHSGRLVAGLNESGEFSVRATVATAPAVPDETVLAPIQHAPHAGALRAAGRR